MRFGARVPREGFEVVWGGRVVVVRGVVQGAGGARLFTPGLPLFLLFVVQLLLLLLLMGVVVVLLVILAAAAAAAAEAAAAAAELRFAPPTLPPSSTEG